jgi:hypothetical protein
MIRLPLFVLPGALLVALGAPHALAQEPAPLAHVAYVEGRAVLEHDTTSEDVEPNLPLDTGDRLRTERGRVEVLLGDGSILQLDEDTTIDVLSDSLIRELAGRLAIIAGSARAGRLQVDTPAGSVRITSPGEFRVSVFDEGGGPEVEVAVIRGSADLFTDGGSVSIAAGARALARQGDAPSQPMSFNSARWDAFDRWSQERLSLRRGAASSRYVPPPLRPYGAVLDTYGSWNYEPTYGYVWFPRVVSGWRPYYQGRWRFYTRFGWTWVGGDVWGWPTHHYGRWGTTSAGAWFWVPGPTWGPAWVHWAVSPGYVSWCPLGFDGRPVVPFGYRYASRRHYRHDPWAAWTLVRRDHFGRFGSVTRVAVDGRRLGREGVRPFVLQAAPPARPLAVARAGVGAASPVRAGSVRVAPRAGVAVPRGAAERAGPAAAAARRGGDQRWNSRSPEDLPTSVRRGPAGTARMAGSAATSGRPDGNEPGQARASEQAGRYGTAVPRRAPTGAGTAPGAAAARRPAPPAWSPDSVPVYRGGTLGGPPELRGVTRSYEGVAPTRRSGSEIAPAAPPRQSDSGRAVPRGASSSGAADDYQSPPAEAPAGARPMPQRPGYQPRTHDQPPAPTPRPPVHGTTDSPGRGYREGPSRGTAPRSPASAEPRQPPARGGYGTAAPRGSAERGGRAERPQGGAPAGGARSARRR